MNELIEPTNLEINYDLVMKNMYKKDLQAKKYLPVFFDILEYYLIGDTTNPVETIPKEFQIFGNNIIVHMYILEMNCNLEWHRDEMRGDYWSKAKYTCILNGSGILEVMDENGRVESHPFHENHNHCIWVKFSHTKRHRFITSNAKMLLATTLHLDDLHKFGPQFFWSNAPGVDAINSIVWEEKLKNLK